MGKLDVPSNRSRWGIAFLVGFGLAVAPCLIAAPLGSFSQSLLDFAVTVGGWLLIFSAVALFRADPARGVANALTGAAVGALTMALLVAGWTTLGQALGGIVSGAAFGAALGVPIGWVVGSSRGHRARKSAVEPERGPPGLHDPWIDSG